MASTWSSSTRSRRSRSSRNSRTAARSCSDCSSGSGTSARRLSCSQEPRRRRRTSDSRLRNRGGTRRTSRTGLSSSRCTRFRTSRSSAESGSRRCAARTTRRDSPPSSSTRGASKSHRSSVRRWSMPTSIPCLACASLNRPDAVNCRVCGRKLETPGRSAPTNSPVALQRVTSGQVFTAVIAEPAKKPAADRAASDPAPRAADVPAVEPEVEDHSDVMAAAVDGIRAKAQGQGHRFKPYVRASDRKATTPAAKQEAAKHLQDAVALLRETRFEDSIDPLLKAIARDDEDRRAWILLAESYLRLPPPRAREVASDRIQNRRVPGIRPDTQAIARSLASPRGVDGTNGGRGAGTRHPGRDGGGVLHRNIVDSEASRRGGCPRRPERASRARAHLRRRLGRDAGRWDPLGPRRPHRRRAGDDEILPRGLDPPAERGAGRPALPVLEPRGTRVEPPQADGLPRTPPRGPEGIARRARPEDGDESPRREERLARGPPGRDSLGTGTAGA